MDMARREFLRIFGAGGMALAAGGAFAKPVLDRGLTLLISDCHINGHLDKYEQHECPSFSDIVAEVARMDPLPARIVCLGDFAYLWGHKEDYFHARKLLKPLTDLGVSFDVALGNHDRRSAFLEAYPEYVKSTKIPGRVVSVVDAGDVDFILLDGLQGADDRKSDDMGPGGGLFCKDQQDWLMAELPKWKKPVFVCSHWSMEGIKIGDEHFHHFLMKSPAVAGYIHGHNHRWRRRLVMDNWGSSNNIHALCLPSTGHWGDIGYALMRTGGDKAVVTLRQKAFWFPSPKSDLAIWKIVARENDGQMCTFLLPKV